jgi:hypothetical protein
VVSWLLSGGEWLLSRESVEVCCCWLIVVIVCCCCALAVVAYWLFLSIVSCRCLLLYVVLSFSLLPLARLVGVAGRKQM